MKPRDTGWLPTFFPLLGVLVLACWLCLLGGCATPPTGNGDAHLTIKAERVAQCKAQGGCALLSQAEVLGMLNEAVEAGAKAALEDLDTHGCRRGAT